MKKILSIGFPYENDLVESADFLSNVSFLDYEIVLWMPDGESLKGKYDSNGNYKILDQLDSNKLLRAVSNRYAEMQGFLELGRTVIIHNSEPELYYCSSVSQIRRFIDAVPLSSEALDMVVSTGKNIEFRGDEPFASFWRKNQSYFKYKAYFKQPIGKLLFFISKTSYVVGYYSKVGDGNLIFIPSVGSRSELNLKPDFDRDFIDSIVVLVNELQKKADDIELPIWSRHYSLPDEHDKRRVLLNLEEELIEVRQKILEEQELIVEIERNKILFVGTGKPLEIQVKKIFEELGFSATEGLPGRDDLILDYNGKIAVVEVKGLGKSAAENNAAQLEKWVSEYYLTKDIKPKGILIVNAYKDIPLKDRNEPAFPHQMLDYTIKRGHCLMTGFQLLGLYLACKRNDAKKEEMIERIFSTDGIFSEYQNWDSFLTFVNEDADKQSL